MVAFGVAFAVGFGVAVAFGFSVGVGLGVGSGEGVGVGVSGGAVGIGVGVNTGVAVGSSVAIRLICEPSSASNVPSCCVSPSYCETTVMPYFASACVSSSPVIEITCGAGEGVARETASVWTAAASAQPLNCGKVAAKMSASAIFFTHPFCKYLRSLSFVRGCIYEYHPRGIPRRGAHPHMPRRC
ncbi:hypothetical protein SDC9_173637 [bioreactor metagenome]|uniref:Uncharacterized protein n=1 Tax=bioreactor metagenome TaxID=1076179 RepID=A0A645GR99_9ZZZZ